MVKNILLLISRPFPIPFVPEITDYPTFGFQWDSNEANLPTVTDCMDADAALAVTAAGMTSSTRWFSGVASWAWRALFVALPLGGRGHKHHLAKDEGSLFFSFFLTLELTTKTAESIKPADEDSKKTTRLDGQQWSAHAERELSRNQKHAGVINQFFCRMTSALFSGCHFHCTDSIIRRSDGSHISPSVGIVLQLHNCQTVRDQQLDVVIIVFWIMLLSK